MVDRGGRGEVLGVSARRLVVQNQRRRDREVARGRAGGEGFREDADEHRLQEVPGRSKEEVRAAGDGGDEESDEEGDEGQGEGEGGFVDAIGGVFEEEFGVRGGGDAADEAKARGYGGRGGSAPG